MEAQSDSEPSNCFGPHKESEALGTLHLNSANPPSPTRQSPSNPEPCTPKCQNPTRTIHLHMPNPKYSGPRPEEDTRPYNTSLKLHTERNIVTVTGQRS